MHTMPMDESQGDFHKWNPIKAEVAGYMCRKCSSDNIWYAVLESNCGGYEDYKFECRDCGNFWWVEGSDS